MEDTSEDSVLYFARVLKPIMQKQEYKKEILSRKGCKRKKICWLNEQPVFDIDWNSVCKLANADALMKYGLCDEFALEEKFFALPPQHLYIYLYLEIGYKYFENIVKSTDLKPSMVRNFIRPLFDNNEITEDKLELIADFEVISETFLRPIEHYRIHAFRTTLTWNDALLARMFKEKRLRSKYYSSTGFNIRSCFKLNDCSLEEDPVHHVLNAIEEGKKKSREQISSVKTYDKFDVQYLRKLAEMFTSTRKLCQKLGSIWYEDDGVKIHTDDTVFNHFLHETCNDAVMVNGTACVGKTSFLQEVVEEIRNKIDPNSRLLKASGCGGFRGKDCEQVLAMQYQLCASGLAKLCYTSVIDRCFFNNLLWRIIQALYNTNTDIVEYFLFLFSLFSPAVIELMKREPIIVIIETNVPRNRKRMFDRDEGGDHIRCRLERYVIAQNLVYGVFATLCNWPLIDLGNFSFNETNIFKKIQQLILEKIILNVERNGKKLPTVSDKASDEETPLFLKRHKFITEYKPEVNIFDYNIAKCIEVLK